MNKIKIVSVIGPSKNKCSKEIYELGMALGKSLIDNRYFIVCGGMSGVMEAVCKGARQSSKYIQGCTIGILPTMNSNDANKYCDIIIPSGLGVARNQLVINSGDVIVALGGGSGTLSEIAFAWQFGKPIICYSGLGGWSEKLAGALVDESKRDKIIEAKSLDDLLKQIKLTITTS